MDDLRAEDRHGAEIEERFERIERLLDELIATNAAKRAQEDADALNDSQWADDGGQV